jgi:hypothetical protein
MAYQGDFAFKLPNAYPAPGEVLQNQVAMSQQDKYRKQELAYREAKEKEADDWKKINLIQDLTNLDKHQTGSDVANSLGNQRASEILQKYTAQASVLSPAELQMKINQEMSGLLNGMDGVKQELELADEQMKMLKTQLPDLDMASIAKLYRADVLDRRVGKDGFTNPLQVAPSQLDFSDPEFLSHFATGNKNLSNSIINPQGAETESVLMGKQGDYTKFEGKLPFWKAPAYDRTKFNNEGFYQGKEIPTLKIKSTTLPSDALPSSNGKPFEVIDKDVYDRFSQDVKLNTELIASTRQAFPSYDNFNPTEKEYAKRHVLFNQIKTLDQNQLHPTFSTKPPSTNTRIYNSTSKDATPIDLREQPEVGGGFKDVTSLVGGVKVTGLPDGKSFAAEYVYYDPSTKTVRYKEYVEKDVDTKKYSSLAKEKTVSLTKFMQDIKTLNPGTDMKFLEGLKTPITGGNTTPKSSTVTVVLKDGRKGEIPSDQLDKFLKDNPGSKRQ